ncbi:PQQ-binding-like beta-propeller repeat protein [Natronosporangium hydrolyticum]|uniref:PQQ-binding-like beta-propeller repeat protein n=1 Tax=Natronosporangium hydrolyticum TaxID=2811111 RepID=A0A895Y9L5_9ACTN|nr:PQQ-binding-like beta-propeller repeat protein [Natronosporangium hydrolyticum]QSB14454.1 PQQ-binding-like beta-propeller repeat protein [Natronosporangium hydrolyticum]
MSTEHSARVIDLGDRSATELVDRQPKAAVGRQRGEQLRRRLLPILAAALAAALLTGLTGGAPERPALDLRFQVTANHFFVDDTYLYTVARQPAPDDDLAVVTAYQLTDGTVAWRTRLDETVDGLSLHPGAGTPYLSSLPTAGRLGDPAGDPAGRVTMLDWQTGELLWTEPGWPIGAAGDTLVVDPNFLVRSEEDNLYVGVDAATGAHRWRIGPLDATLNVAAGHVVGLTGGDLVSFHPETGEPVQSTPAPEPADRPERIPVSVVGSLALLLDDGDPPVMHAFDLAGLTPQWQVEWDEEWGFPIPRPCDPVICLGTPGGGIGGLDPATGALRWRSTSTATLPSEHPDDGVMLFSDLARQPAQQLVATETGEVLLELTGWRALEPPEVSWSPMTAPALGRLTVRDFDDVSWLGWIAADYSGVEPVAPLPHPTDWCTHSSTYLVCAEGGSRINDLTVWRLRR